MTVTCDNHQGVVYWGSGPLPHDLGIIGTVCRDGELPGALLGVHMAGFGKLQHYWQGNAGVLRSLPQTETDAAVDAALTAHHKAGLARADAICAERDARITAGHGDDL